MDVFQAITIRRSIRNYKPTPVPSEKLQKILEAARLAPSAINKQPWHFIVVTDTEKRKFLSTGLFAKFLKQTPVVIVACGDKKASPKWHIVDVAIAVQNMVLTATEEGLGTCIVGSFNENQVRELLKIPDNLHVIVLLAIGYPSGKESLPSKILRTIRKRKPIQKIISKEEYGKPYELTGNNSRFI